jgi:hypothetical protein
MSASPEPDGAGAVFAKLWDVFERGGLIVLCAWCRSVCIEEEWIVAPASVFSAIDGRNSLTHSICPECAATSAARTERGAPELGLQT